MRNNNNNNNNNLKNQHRSLCSVKPLVMTPPCTGCYSEKAHDLRLFNLTLELGAAGYEVLTYCFVCFFFVGWGHFGLSRASCHLCIPYLFFLSLEEGSW
jgi:hypothetical protein